MTTIDRIVERCAAVPAGKTAAAHHTDVLNAVRALRRLNMSWSESTIHTAIKSNNHPLIRWVIRNGVPTNDETIWEAIRARNVFALHRLYHERHIILETPHFEEVARSDDIIFLNHMWQIRCAWDDLVSLSYTAGTPIRVRRAVFTDMLSGKTDNGKLGFRWLSRRGLIDRA